jgi:hypothetical protein
MERKIKYMKAKFSYFNISGKHYTKGKGRIREKWLEEENGATERRDVIMEDNDGALPGVLGRGEQLFILVRTKGLAPFLIEPEDAEEDREIKKEDRELGRKHGEHSKGSEPKRVSRAG